MAARIFFLLSSLGLAITAEAQDCAKPVLGPNMNLKGNSILLNEFPDGQKVNLACEIGYSPARGSTAITCNAGTWTAVTLECDLKDCGRADDPVNGEVRYPDGTAFGATAVVVCSAGHRLVGQSDKILCGDQGWMGRVPVCEVQKCDPPAPIPNGLYSPVKEIYEYRDVVEIQCQGSSSLIGAKSLMCSENGSFTPSPPTCKDVNCEKPEIPNSVWISGARVTYKYKSSVTHDCITGYEVIGSKTSVCESDGEWVPKLLECKPKNCSVPSGTNMRLKGKNDPSEIFPNGAVVTFICNDDFESEGGQAESTCAYGKWSPVTLKCKRKTSSTKPPPKTTPTNEGNGDGENKDSSGSNNVGIAVGVVVLVLALGGGAAYGVHSHNKKKSKQEGFQEVQKAPDEEDAKL